MRSKYEIKAEKELQADGWLVDNKAYMVRWSKNRDFFHLWDLVAYKPGKLHYISIKGHIGGKQRREHLAELEKMVLPPGVTNELWIWPDNKKKKEWIKIKL